MANLFKEFLNDEGYDALLPEGIVRKSKLMDNLKIQPKRKTEAREMKEKMLTKQKVKYTRTTDRLLGNLKNRSKQNRSCLPSRKLK